MIKLHPIFRKITLSRLLNGLFIIVVLALIFIAPAKALMIRGLMIIGLFQPDVPKTIDAGSYLNSAAISFKSADGKIVNLADQKGKVVFINFWATWCPPCIAEMPSVNQLHEKLKGNKNIVFIMVDADNDFGRSASFMSKHDFSLPIYQANSTMPNALFSGTLPTTVIVDKTGKIIFRHEGVADYGNAKLLAYLQKLSR